MTKASICIKAVLRILWFIKQVEEAACKKGMQKRKVA